MKNYKLQTTITNQFQMTKSLNDLVIGAWVLLGDRSLVIGILNTQSLTQTPRPAKTPDPGFFTTFSTKTVPFRCAFSRKTAENSLAAGVFPVNGGFESDSQRERS